MGKISIYEDYFREMARKYVPISHTEAKPRFWTLNVAEIMASKRSKMNLNEWNLILLQFEPKLVTNDSRRFQFLTVGGFEIIKNVSRNDLAYVQTKDDALNYCREVVAKMMTEYKDGQFPLGVLIESSIDFYLIDQEFDTAVGAGISFQFYEGFSRTELINQNNWIV